MSVQLFCDLRACDEKGGNGSEDHFRDHVHTVIDDRIYEAQKRGVQTGNQLCAPCREAVLSEEPLCPAGVENITGEDMGYIPGTQRYQRAAHQTDAGIFAGIAENAAKSQQGVGKDVVQKYHQQGIYTHERIRTGQKRGRDGSQANDHFD